MKSSLTIGIPTFNRRDAVLERISELFAKPLPSNVAVLVIDNHSTDGTFDAVLAAQKTFPDLRVIKNSENRGYAGNFFRLFEEAQTDYLLIDSDEDEVLIDKIDDFLEFLDNKKPSFCSPQAIVFERVYRGAGKEGLVAPADFKRCSFYLSGITFNVELGRKACEKVKPLVDKNEAVHVYPQILLVVELLLEGRCVWYSSALTVKRQQLHSHIANSDGSAYYHLVGRWRQSLGFIDYISDRADFFSGDDHKLSALNCMLVTCKSNLFSGLRSGISHERPELIEDFDKSARCFYSRSYRFSSLLFRSVKSPKKALAYVWRRLT